MSSSTSNSKLWLRAQKRFLIGLSLLLCFGTAEVKARKYARRHENDLSEPKDFTSIGARADHLMHQKGLKIVFVGNSATQEGADFVFSYLSILFAMREVTQEKLLHFGAPGYENWVSQLNEMTGQQIEARRKLPQNQAKARELERSVPYHALERLLRRARENRAKLCFIAYPRRDATRRELCL